MILSPKEIDYQIDCVLDKNDLPLESLLKPLVESASKATAKKIFDRLGPTSGRSALEKDSGWRELKKEIEG